jgi:hypothetical protein
MTQYLLSVYMNDDDPAFADMTPDEMQQIFAAVDAFNAEVKDAGAWVFAGGLNPPSSATTVKSVDGDVTITDGPYAETKEQIGGFWIIEAPDLDAALQWAAKGSAACAGAVEVRPFQDEPPA